MDRYDRLYFGHEFCERLLPGPEDVRRALEIAAETDMAFTLVTPYMSDGGMDSLAALLEVLLRHAPGSEIVLNDWGTLVLLREVDASGRLLPVLGRLLTKQARDPRLHRAADTLSSGAMDHFKRTNVDTPMLTRFLREQGVTRVELDNPEHGIERDDPAIPASLYTPFVYLTTTRVCVTNSRFEPSASRRVVMPCAFECRTASYRLRHERMPCDLQAKGNTIFVRNDVLPTNLAAVNVDRIVHQLSLPV